MQTDNPKIEELSFAEAMAQLQDVVASMESEQTPLEQAVQLFEQGTKLAQHCRTILDGAERKITELMPDQSEVDFE